MELVVNTSKLNTIPEQEERITKSLGFLNSCYKSVVKETLKNASGKSVFGVRRRIKNWRYYFVSRIEVALKLSLFLVAILAIFN